MNPHNRSDTLINGHTLRRHGQHAWCAPERDGLCVTLALHQEFKGKAASKSEDDLRAWYTATIARYAGQDIGDDRFVFWRNEFAQWIGLVTARPAERVESGTLSAAKRVLKDRLETIAAKEAGHVRLLAR